MGPGLGARCRDRGGRPSYEGSAPTAAVHSSGPEGCQGDSLAPEGVRAYDGHLAHGPRCVQDHQRVTNISRNLHRDLKYFFLIVSDSNRSIKDASLRIMSWAVEVIIVIECHWPALIILLQQLPRRRKKNHGRRVLRISWFLRHSWTGSVTLWASHQWPGEWHQPVGNWVK